jgi:prolyl-tRNA editing enzyme YbaK/EbsC (Cys-tRNA(Pro) deacylase)
MFAEPQIVKYWKQLQNANCVDKAGRSKFHFRLVNDQDAVKLTGYQFNGITPFCMETE